MRRSGWLAVCLIVGTGLLAVAGASAAAASPAYFRYPDVHGDRVVFSAEADLWVAPATGGMARRLTTHPGTEYFPKFSPDGSRIAFTGEYDGNRDVYVIPADGGEPRRLTWRPGPDEVIGWTPDGKRILFRSASESPLGEWELYSMPADGGDPEKLPLGWAARIAIDPGTGAWAFNRKSWEYATWKRYRGGTAPDIWVGSPDRRDFRAVTTFEGINAFPMWHGGRIYFLSDQGGTMNIWSMRPDGSDRKRHTDFKDWDARWPSMSPDGRIAFTLGADIHVFDAPSGGERRIDVDLPSDLSLTRVRYPDADRTLTSFDLSPDGSRLAIVTRGEIFSVPAKQGVTLPVTHGSGARESWATFDPDGKKLAYVTDAPGEEEIRVIDAWGRDEPKTVVPAGESGWHFPPVFSPDGKWIAYADETQTLYLVPAEGGTPKAVDRSTQREIREYAFSPDGRWLAYAKTRPTDFGSIYIYDTKERKVHEVTGSTTNDRTPSWDPDGRYLYFLSDRVANPILGDRDWDNVEAKNTKIYAVLLRKDVKHPFMALEGLPPTDEKKDAGKEGDKDKAKDAKDEKGKDDKGKGDEKAGEKKPPKPVEIDLDGLPARVVEFPVPVGRYGGLGATSKQVFFLSAPLKGMAEQPGLFEEPPPEASLMAFDLEKKEVKPFMEGVSTFAVASKADKIAVMKKRGEIYVVDAAAPPGPDMAKSKVSLDGIVIELDPREEWAQMYREGWRHERDFFWDPGMGGVDWKAVRDRYATLLPRLANRSDLRDLMGEVIGELNNSHTYTWGGDPGVQVPQVATGALGADLVREGDAYRVAKIYRADPADGVRSPLDEPGSFVSVGEYILAVNHRPFPKGLPFEASMENLAGKGVVLTVNAKPVKEGSRDVVITALPSDEELRYVDWVRANREYVAQKSGGKIGYLHLPDMWQHGLIQFNRWFYPQLDREGMVVDARFNHGGAVSQMIVERLRRRIVSLDRARGGGISRWPASVLNGPFVVLTNEFAGSDGDIFPAAIQLEKLAPVIGMRSWGGVVGIRGDKLLVDGGMLTQPEFAWWEPKRGWAIENHGVDPDIVIQNMPQDLARGVDAQLDRALEEVLKLRKEHPPIEPAFGPARDRSREGFRQEMKK
jgi:tricorn protease